MSLQTQVEDLRAAVQCELDRERSKRTSGASTSELEMVLDKLDAWIADAEVAHLRGIGRLAVDRWSLTSSLSERVVHLEQSL